MEMSLPPALVPGLIIAQDAIIHNVVAASMFIIWDHCITFGQEEVDLIWRPRWTLANFLFVIIRYLALAVRIVELVFYTNVAGLIRPSQPQCTAWLRYEAASGQLLFFCVEILLITRVFAFYGRDKRLLAVLIFLFVLENAARITILGLTLPKIVVTPNPLPPHLHVGACIVMKVPHLFSSYWIPALIFESILFILVVARFIQTKIHAEIDSPHVLIVFVRDGAWAFTMIFGTLLWCSLSFELTPAKGDVGLTWLFSVMGFCGTRLVLNLRSAAAENPAVTTDEGFELKFKSGVFTESGTSGSESTDYASSSKSRMTASIA